MTREDEIEELKTALLNANKLYGELADEFKRLPPANPECPSHTVKKGSCGWCRVEELEKENKKLKWCGCNGGLRGPKCFDYHGESSK